MADGLESIVAEPETQTGDVDLLSLFERLTQADKCKTIEDLEDHYKSILSKFFGVEEPGVKIFISPAEAEKYFLMASGTILQVPGQFRDDHYTLAAIECSDPLIAERYGEVFDILQHSIARTIETMLKIWVDAKTNLFTEEYRDRYMERRRPVTEASRKGYGIIMLDIDKFGHFNKTYGHEAGDEALGKVGDAVRRSIREEDLTWRRGQSADEVLVYADGCSIEDMGDIAERIKQAIHEYAVCGEHLTASFGLAHSSEVNLIGRRRILRQLELNADKRMYESKDKGGNQITGPNSNQFRVRAPNSYLAGGVVYTAEKGEGRVIRVG